MIILPVRQTVLFPGIVLPLAIARPSSIAAAQEAVRSERMLGVILQTDPAIEDPTPEQLHRVGNRRASSPLRHRGRRHASCGRARHAALSRDRVSSRLSVPGGAGRGNRRRRSHDGRGGGARKPGSKPGSRSYPAAAERPRGSGRRDREIGFGIRACRFHRRHHRCEALGEAGGAGDDRRQGAPRQGAGAACATHRSLEAFEADRRTDTAIALLPAARAYLARAASAHSEGAGRRRREVGRNRRAARADRKGRDAEGGRGPGQERAQAARAHAGGLPRIRDDPRPIWIG